ncbi:Gfo/Idh/MocA family protein [Segetibacter aerophilus]|uniref:NADH-dependent dehydrogenase n=1 Tax=Segetibacter aerophilus TaxID=670293 RepID=A0A512BJ43_9BACT|nr:Gfo/Idh/MocA family oxidoreductase [Segetibacter aerophilus]GEO11895.1 NADH-dependent dehydrogenase [Segetibacter aerophilus]
MSFTRRKFINDTSKIIAATGLSTLAPASMFASVRRNNLSPNEKITVGLIGAKNMGFGDLKNALKQPNVECVGICDIDDTILNDRTAEVTKLQGKVPIQYKDFRKLIDNKDIDAVIIGTPDHWHCLPFIYACQAGKDIYVEKPLANSIGECDVMVKAARKYNRVVQVGQQQHTGSHFNGAMDFMKSGKIGQIRKVNIWANFNYGTGQPAVPDEAVPAGVDFETWLGPAPQRTFNKARFHGSWRMFWDYGGGLMTDWGVHLLDMALWVKDVAYTPPPVTAAGGNFSFPNNAHETFDTMSVSYQMKDYTINWEHSAGLQQGPYGRTYGLAFVGNDATLVLDRSSWELFPEYDNAKKTTKVPAMPKQTGADSQAEHMKNFLECVKSRKDPNCTIENGRLVAAYAHMANIALRTNSRLVWNENDRNFGKNDAANALIMPKYRKPWSLPKV